MEQTLSEMTYQSLKNDINTLVLSADEFLNEQQLTQRYGTSKAPIRSALHRLCMEGILVSHPRKGYLIVTLNEKEFQQVQSLRLQNERYAVSLLIEHATRHQLDELMSIAENGRTVKDNMSFHASLGRLTGNRFLEDIITRLLSHVTRTINMHSFDEDSSSFMERHIAIVDALLARDREKAGEALKRDIL